MSHFSQLTSCVKVLFSASQQMRLLLGLTLLVCSALSSAKELYPLPQNSLNGSWDGLFHCMAYNVQYELSIKTSPTGQLTAKLKGEMRQIKRRNYKMPKQKLDFVLQGEFDRSYGTFVLKAESGRAENTLSLAGVYEPISKQMTAVVQYPFLQTCSYAIMGHGNTKKAIKNILKAGDTTPKISNPSTAEPCSPSVKKWLAQTENFAGTSPYRLEHYAFLLLIQDQYFKPFFKKSFYDSSDKELSTLFLQLTSYCRNEYNYNPRVAQVTQAASDIIQNIQPKTRVDAYLYPEARKIVNDWKKAVGDNLKKQDSIDSRALENLSQLAALIDLLQWPLGGSGLDSEITQLIQKTEGRRLLADLDNAIAQANPNINGLVSIAQFPLRINNRVKLSAQSEQVNYQYRRAPAFSGTAKIDLSAETQANATQKIAHLLIAMHSPPRKNLQPYNTRLNN